jgi:hypothetical protein
MPFESYVELAGFAVSTTLKNSSQLESFPSRLEQIMKYNFKTKHVFQTTTLFVGWETLSTSKALPPNTG